MILTSSGGPFRGRSARELADVTPEEALKHPTWRMGPKITIDSATLMNKALEVIEARWLFELEPEQIEVVDPSGERGALDGRVRRRQRDRPALAARHAAADPVRADLPRPRPRPVPAARPDASRSRCTSSRRTGRRSRAWTWASR